MNTGVYLISDGKDIPLDIAEFDWPMYTGARSRPVALEISDERLEEFEKIKNGPHKLRFVYPARHGTTEQDKIEIQGVYVDVGIPQDNGTFVLRLYDKRVLLARLVQRIDFNLVEYISSGGVRSVFGTAPTDKFTGSPDGIKCTIKYALEQIDLLAEASSSVKLGISANIVHGGDTLLPPNLYLAGVTTIEEAIDFLLAKVGLEITVDTKGEFVVYSPSDEQAALGDIAWVDGMAPDTEVKLLPGYPAKVNFLYEKVIKTTISTTNQSVVQTKPTVFPEFYMEQVYDIGGKYMNVDQLVAAYRVLVPNASGNRVGLQGRMARDIPKSITSDTWEKTLLQTFGYDETPGEKVAAAYASGFVRAIKSGFGKYWRIVISSGLNNSIDRYLKDANFGDIDSFGNPIVGPVAEGDWAESYVYPNGNWSATSISETGEDFNGNIPVNASWVDRSLGVFKLAPIGESSNLANIYPGYTWVVPPGMRLATAQDTAAYASSSRAIPKNIFVPATNAELDDDVNIRVTIHGVQVTGPDRFFVVSKDTGHKNGTPLIEIKAPPYPKIVERRVVGQPVLFTNEPIVNSDSDFRFKDFENRFKIAPSVGIAHGCSPVTKLKRPFGKVSQLTIKFCYPEDYVVTTQVDIGIPSARRQDTFRYINEYQYRAR